MKKYQISVNIGKSADKNSASTKAVRDCIQIFTSLGYENHNLFYNEKTPSAIRYLMILKELIRFFILLKKRSLVAVQYPMLNNVFKYFIKAARLKRVKLFCIIHDIESLRLGGKDDNLIIREIGNLNYYDCIIVHNTQMLQWLKDKGITTEMIPLGAFDYLAKEIARKDNAAVFSQSIVFAGNLSKSNFIYSLNKVGNWTFKVYGPNYNKKKNQPDNVTWVGEYPPDEIANQLSGDFGLIWDGNEIDKCDEVLGNYLRYNNPHKFSLYLAAGLPVIAPKNSAIAKMIIEKKIGILIDSLTDLVNLELTEKEYKTLKDNCGPIKKDLTKGKFFLKALETVEMKLAG